MAVTRHEFASWDAFIKAAHGPTDMRSERSSRREDSNKGCTVAQAHRYASLGWLEGAERARKYSDALFTKLANLIERIEINYRVEGHAIDIGRFVEGEPECWQEFGTSRVEGPSTKFIRIVVNVAASWDVEASTIMARGAVLTALVNLFEHAGHRVEVTIVNAITGRSNSDRWEMRTVIKRFDEPIDLPKVAYAIAHPSVLRVHTWALRERESESVRHSINIPGNYGYPADIIEQDSRGDIYCGRMYSGESVWLNETSAVAWLRETLTEQGVNVREEATR